MYVLCAHIHTPHIVTPSLYFVHSLACLSAHLVVDPMSVPYNSNRYQLKEDVTFATFHYRLLYFLYIASLTLNSISHRYKSRDPDEPIRWSLLLAMARERMHDFFKRCCTPSSSIIFPDTLRTFLVSIADTRFKYKQQVHIRDAIRPHRAYLHNNSRCGGGRLGNKLLRSTS